MLIRLQMQFTADLTDKEMTQFGVSELRAHNNDTNQQGKKH